MYVSNCRYTHLCTFDKGHLLVVNGSRAMCLATFSCRRIARPLPNLLLMFCGDLFTLRASLTSTLP